MSVLFGLLMRVIRFPIDLLLMTWHSARACWNSLTRFIPRRDRPGCIFCRTPENVGLEDRIIPAATRFANLWMFKIVCPCMRYPDAERFDAPHCGHTRIQPRVVWHLPFVTAGLLLAWLGIGAVGWRLAEKGRDAYVKNQAAPGAPEPVRNAAEPEIRAEEKPPAAKAPEDGPEETADKPPVFKDGFDAALARGRELFEDEAYREAHISFQQAVVLRPENADAHLALGRCYLEFSKFALAEKEFHLAVSLDEACHEAQLLLGELSLAKGEPVQAITHFEKLSASHREDARYHLLLAGARISNAEEEAGRAELAQALKLAPDDVPTLVHAARLYSRLADYERAESLFKHAVELDPDHVKSWIGWSIVLGLNGDLEQAEAILDKAGERMPNHPDVMAQQAELKLSAGRVADAVRAYEQIIADHPERHMTKARLAEIHFKAGHTDQGKVLADELTDSGIKRVKTKGHMMLANAYASKRLFTYADKHVRLALMNDPEEPDQPAAHLLAAKIAAARQDFGRAISELSLVLDARPAHFEAAMLLASAWERSEDPVKAREVLETARDRHPKSPFPLARLGRLHFDAGRLDEAISAYEQALERVPDHPVAVGNLAMILASGKRDLPRARKLAEFVYEGDPRNPVYQDVLGWVKVRQGELEAGRLLLEQALAGIPGSPELRFHLAYALHRLGDSDQAKEELKRALDLSGSFVGVKEAEALKLQLETADEENKK